MAPVWVSWACVAALASGSAQAQMVTGSEMTGFAQVFGLDEGRTAKKLQRG